MVLTVTIAMSIGQPDTIDVTVAIGENMLTGCPCYLILNQLQFTHHTSCWRLINLDQGKIELGLH